MKAAKPGGAGAARPGARERTRPRNPDHTEGCCTLLHSLPIPCCPGLHNCIISLIADLYIQIVHLYIQICTFKHFNDYF